MSIRYDTVYGYVSNLSPERVFKTMEEAAEFDVNEAARMLGFSLSSLTEKGKDALIHLAAVIEDKRLDENLTKWRADKVAKQPTDDPTENLSAPEKGVPLADDDIQF